LECGGLTPPCRQAHVHGGPWRSQGGVKPPHSKALRATIPGQQAELERSGSKLLHSKAPAAPQILEFLGIETHTNGISTVWSRCLSDAAVPSGNR